MPKPTSKKKVPQKYLTAPEHTEPFGFKAQDLIRTPLGVTVTVLGVRYDDTADASSARLWVKYQSGLEAPLEPRVGVGHLAALGYNSCTPFDYIERDLKSLRMDIEKRHQYRQLENASQPAAAAAETPTAVKASLGKPKEKTKKKP
eukprot:jgi/Botrbrau1/17300/Bobra.0015s0056.2